MQTFDTEKTLQQYYQKKAEKEAENQKFQQQQAEEKAKTTAYYANLKANGKTVKTKKDFPCERCGTTIPAHTRVHIGLEPIPIKKGVYGNGYTKRVHFCQKCRPINEAEKHGQ